MTEIQWSTKWPQQNISRTDKNRGRCGEEILAICWFAKWTQDNMPREDDRRVYCGDKSIWARERAYQDNEWRLWFRNFIVVRWWKEDITYLFTDCTKILDKEFPKFFARKQDWDVLRVSEDFFVILEFIVTRNWFTRSFDKKTKIATFEIDWVKKTFPVEFVKKDWIIYY